MERSISTSAVSKAPSMDSYGSSIHLEHLLCGDSCRNSPVALLKDCPLLLIDMSVDELAGSLQRPSMSSHQMLIAPACTIISSFEGMPLQCHLVLHRHGLEPRAEVFYLHHLGRAASWVTLQLHALADTGQRAHSCPIPTRVWNNTAPNIRRSKFSTQRPCLRLRCSRCGLDACTSYQRKLCPTHT